MKTWETRLRRILKADQTHNRVPWRYHVKLLSVRVFGACLDCLEQHMLVFYNCTPTIFQKLTRNATQCDRSPLAKNDALKEAACAYHQRLLPVDSGADVRPGGPLHRIDDLLKVLPSNESSSKHIHRLHAISSFLSQLLQYESFA